MCGNYLISIKLDFVFVPYRWKMPQSSNWKAQIVLLIIEGIGEYVSNFFMLLKPIHNTKHLSQWTKLYFSAPKKVQSFELLINLNEQTV
jgi:hypothetical protein